MEEKRVDYNKLVDRISALSDEILVSILSFLPLEEAAATSILSRRWQYVWAYTMTLNFDISEKTLSRLRNVKLEERVFGIRRFVDWVSSVVEQHRCPRIERFRVRFDLNSAFSSSIDKWIQFAMRKGVQMLELDFSGYAINPEWSEKYTFLGECLGIKKGSSNIPSLHPSVYIGFKSLKVLHFKTVHVDGEVLEYFLSNCPVLERLSVYHSLTLGKLRVVGPSIALKYLVLEICDNMESIEICDANLVSFIYEGNEIKFLLRNVPLLVEVSIFYYPILNVLEVAFNQLSCCLSQLQILKMNRMPLVYKKTRVFPILENLKHLKLQFDLHDGCDLLQYLTSFIKASPYLHKLELVVESMLELDCETPLGKRVFEKPTEHSHQYLKFVKLLGYDGRPTFELVEYLTETAVKLEKIVIDPDPLLEDIANDSSLEEIFYFAKRLVDIGEVEREENRQKLKEKVPSTVELIWL